jgi:hypothetical protein
VGEGAGPGDRHQPSARRGRAGAPALGRPRPAPRRRRQPGQHPLRRCTAFDADDEHGAEPPPSAGPRLQRLLRASLRGRSDHRPLLRRHRPRAARRSRPGR